MFRQNESFSFVCQNVTGGSGDIFALHIQSSGLLRMEEIPANGSDAKKKKKGTDRKTILVLLVQRHPSTSKGNGIEIEGCSRYKGQKNHHCYCHPIFSSFFFPFHVEYLATKGLHLMRTHLMSAKDLIMCPCGALCNSMDHQIYSKRRWLGNLMTVNAICGLLLPPPPFARMIFV